MQIPLKQFPFYILIVQSHQVEKVEEIGMSKKVYRHKLFDQGVASVAMFILGTLVCATSAAS